MAFKLQEVQKALSEDGLDGWLLYDFHGTNPIARTVVGLNGGGKMTTRRWFYLIPATGEPRALVHADPAARRSAFGAQLPLDLPFPVAAKTGTSSGFADTYTVAATREVVVAACSE